MLTHAEITEILKREVYAADERLRDASGKVDSILAEVPNSVQQPDGNYRVTKAMKEQASAREALAKAVKRNCDFTLKGIVPENLK